MNVDILFDKPNKEYHAGETLHGNIMMTLEKPMPITDIQVHLVGKGNVSWSESEGTGDDQRTVWYTNQESYLDQQIIIYQSPTGSARIGTGTTNYYFSCILPPDLPESFASHIGNVKYEAKIKVKSSENITFFKSKYKKAEEFTVHTTLQIPNHLNELAIVEGRKNIRFLSECCCCCWTGKISVKMTTDKGGYLPGELILFNAEIDSSSCMEMNNIKLTMKQQVVYIASGGRTTTSFNVIGTKVTYPEALNANSSFAWPLTMTAPTDYPPTDLGTCKIMKIGYILELKIGEDVGCCSPDVHFRIAFMLGSASPSCQPTVSYSHPNVVTQQPLSFEKENILLQQWG